jgi:cysteine-rich repeat protein
MTRRTLTFRPPARDRGIVDRVLRLALAGVLMTTLTAHAFVGRVDAPYTSTRDDRIHRVLAWQPPTARARDAFATLAAAGWHAQWDRDTGVPAWLWGGRVEVPGAVADGVVAERAARQFLAQHVSVLAPGAKPQDFELVANQRDGELRSVGFRQLYRGVPVLGGQIGFVFGHDRLVAITSQALPGVQVAITRSAIDPARAASWVSAAIGRPAHIAGVKGRAILPSVRGAGDIAYDVVEIVDVRADLGAWDVYVASDGMPLARRNRVQFGASTLVYNAGDRYATGTRSDVAVPRVPIHVDGSPTTTDGTGGFTWPGTAPATVEPGLANDRVVVVNHGGDPATAMLSAQDGEHVAWNLATDEFGDAQLSTLVYGERVKERDRAINPSIAAWIDQPLAFYVNEGGMCNAFSTGDEVHFFRASQMCQNTGRIADIVYHEFGHSFHFHSLIPGVGFFDGSESEGLADFNAALITEDSGVGRGFFYSDVPTREIDPVGFEKRWPEDQDPDPHVTGEIISGALWDLRHELVTTLGHDAGVAATERIFAGILQRSSDIPTTYVAALVADDDDGDLANGTPHQCSIDRAFGAHGLAEAPATTVGLPVLAGDAISVDVTTPANPACPPAAVTSIVVVWQPHGGEPAMFSLARQGTTWTGTFPSQPAGTVVEYRVEAMFDDASKLTFPNNRADPMYQRYVGTVEPIYCTTFDQDPQWKQAGNHGIEWQVASPQGLSGDPATPYTGTLVLGTNVTGDGRYLANEISYTETPEIDVSGYVDVRLQYRRWLTVEDSEFDVATIAVNKHEVWRNATSPLSIDHIDKEWRFHDIDLTPQLSGTTAQVRFELSSDGIKQLGGWNLDDVCIVGIPAPPVCGNGTIDPGETCDDGNAIAGDGCSTSCQEEFTAGGGGGCDAGGSTSGGWLVLSLGALSAAVAARAGGRRDRSRIACRSRCEARADRSRS